MLNDRSIDAVRMRSYSSAFSRGAIMDVIRFNDFSRLSWVYNHYDKDLVHADSYFDYLRLMYKALSSDYRCEYVYKNEVIRNLLAKYRTQNTAIFNEFKVGKSIADLVFINGESRAFEIKTDLDTPKRLEKQISDYRKVFDACYVVIPDNRYQQYAETIAPETGIITMSQVGKKLALEEKRGAIKNATVDVDVLMSVFHTDEYKRFIVQEFGALPLVPGHQMYDVCREMMQDIPLQKLKFFFHDTLKRRKNNTTLLKKVPMEFRQMFLSLGLDERGAETLLQRLNARLG